MGRNRLKRMRPKKVSMSRSLKADAKEAGVGASPAGRCFKAFNLCPESNGDDRLQTQSAIIFC
jgi:hypothetical protein